MAWFTQPQEIADAQGNPTGRWRMTATSDDGGGGPHSDTSHDHLSPAEAQDCERCDEFIAGVTGFPSRKKMAADRMAGPALCDLCGEPMPEGEEMFRYHGHSGPCPEREGAGT